MFSYTVFRSHGSLLTGFLAPKLNRFKIA
ncbi:MAG: hypothetical protein ACI8Z1_002309, partial [Candidatus Azotimanducaceae bacterium]